MVVYLYRAMEGLPEAFFERIHFIIAGNIAQGRMLALKIKTPFLQSGHPPLNVVRVLYAHLIQCHLGFVRTDTCVAD